MALHFNPLERLLVGVYSNPKETTSRTMAKQDPFKFETYSDHTEEISVEELTPADEIIIAMGPTGSGKSSFIEIVTGVAGIAGHELVSCSQHISIFRATLMEWPDTPICFVDTPGFDDTYKSDLEIFKELSAFLINMHRRKLRLRGVLYFHRICDNRMGGTTLRTLHNFEQLCGQEHNKIVITTTMWDLMHDDDGEIQEKKLRETYWESMIARGTSVKRFFPRNRATAIEVLNPLLTSNPSSLHNLKDIKVEGSKTAVSSMIRPMKSTTSLFAPNGGRKKRKHSTPTGPNHLLDAIRTDSSVLVEEITDYVPFEDDRIIVVMGPTGAGKSTFIETATGLSGRAGHDLESRTKDISIYKLIMANDQDESSLILVDTPGFDDTHTSDVEIFNKISNWLNSTYKNDVQLFGLLFLHRISDNRMAGTPLKNWKLFEKLCGKDFKKIVITTTMWDEVNERQGAMRETDLEQVYWKTMISRGSCVRRFLRTRSSVVDVLKPIFDAADKKKALLIQQEVVDQGMTLNQTSAGHSLFLALEAVVAEEQVKLKSIQKELRGSLSQGELSELMETYRATQNHLQIVAGQAKLVKASITDRIWRVVKSLP